jgi:hypothetical protein
VLELNVQKFGVLRESERQIVSSFAFATTSFLLVSNKCVSSLQAAESLQGSSLLAVQNMFFVPAYRGFDVALVQISVLVMVESAQCLLA